MLRQRILTAVLLLPAFVLAVLQFSRGAWAACALAIAAIGALEWARLTVPGPLVAGGLTAAVVAGCSTVFIVPWAGPVVLAVGTLFWLIVAPWMLATSTRPRRSSVLALIGWVVLVSAWWGLVVLQDHPGRLLTLLGVVWVADSAAYFIGRRCGRRRLAPAISPGKTWEGVVGAVAAVGVYYVVMWIVLAPAFLGGARMADAVLVAVMTVLSVEGDLFESWLKRRAGVKDSGTLLPGHGGMLDRIDGVLAVVPPAALLHVVLAM